jgi:putative endonuclease
MTASRQRRGRWGEDLAARWYEAQGYRVLARRWRCRDGEIDLIVQLDQLVVFCEVKARSSARFGTGVEAVDWRKQRRLRGLAARWLTDNEAAAYRQIRFDVVSVLGGDVTVVEAAF